jgi:hypothetical protein
MEPAAGVTNARTSKADGKPRKWAGYEQVGTSGVAVRNSRDVWILPYGKFPGGHTGTFPPALPERCIRASTSEHGACFGCGAPWRRRTRRSTSGGNLRHDGSVQPEAIPTPETIGWEPTCGCGISDVVPCLVLDPFAGSGTTLAVAKSLGRDYVGIELNEKEYGPLIERRLREAVVVAPEDSVTKPTRRGATNGHRKTSSR